MGNFSTIRWSTFRLTNTYNLQIALNSYTAQTGIAIAPDTESVVQWLSELLELFDEENRWIK